MNRKLLSDAIYQALRGSSTKDPLFWRVTDRCIRPFVSVLGYEPDSLRRKESWIEREVRRNRALLRKMQDDAAMRLALIRGDGPEREREREAREKGYKAGFERGAATRSEQLEDALKDHVANLRSEFQAQRSAILEELVSRNGQRCGICGSDEKLSVDHDVPLAAGGSNDISNLQILCLTCNTRKGARPYLRVI